MTDKKKIVVAVTGASGAIYARCLLDRLSELSSQYDNVAVIFSAAAIDVWKYELENEDWKNYSFTFYENSDFFSPLASGSAAYDTMIICPCTMGTLGRIAQGSAETLITRCADVMLKEKKKLILVPREAPYNLIHIRNMETVCAAGAIVYPANPIFYDKPKNIDDLVHGLINRILHIAELQVEKFSWGDNT